MTSGQPQRKGASSPGLTLGRQAAVLRLGQSMSNSQAKPGTGTGP